MGLQNEERSERFRNNRHKTVANILFTYNNVASRLQKLLNGYKLTLQQYNIMRILYRYHPEPACNLVIREQMLDARSDITRIVDRLIKEKLVNREVCHHDRRKVNIRLTPSGLKLLREMEHINEKMDRIASGLTEEELLELSRLLEKVRETQ